jgi:hypothetical protein
VFPRRFIPVTRGLLLAFAVCVGGQVLYHTLLKGTPNDTSPFLLISLAYLLGCIFVGITGLLNDRSMLVASIGPAVFARAFAIGVAVSCIELGYLYAYRNGFPLGTGPVTVLAVTSVALIPIGILLYRDRISLQNVVGAVIALFGLWLIRR